MKKCTFNGGTTLCFFPTLDFLSIKNSDVPEHFSPNMSFSELGVLTYLERELEKWGSLLASVALGLAQNIRIASLRYPYSCASDAWRSLGASVALELAQNIRIASLRYPYSCTSDTWRSLAASVALGAGSEYPYSIFEIFV